MHKPAGLVSTDSQNSQDDLKTESIRSSLHNPKFQKRVHKHNKSHNSHDVQNTNAHS
jgi:hypothetical protein